MLTAPDFLRREVCEWGLLSWSLLFRLICPFINLGSLSVALQDGMGPPGWVSEESPRLAPMLPPNREPQRVPADTRGRQAGPPRCCLCVSAGAAPCR